MFKLPPYHSPKEHRSQQRWSLLFASLPSTNRFKLVLGRGYVVLWESMTSRSHSHHVFHQMPSLVSLGVYWTLCSSTKFSKNLMLSSTQSHSRETWAVSLAGYANSMCLRSSENSTLVSLQWCMEWRLKKLREILSINTLHSQISSPEHSNQESGQSTSQMISQALFLLAMVVSWLLDRQTLLIAQLTL